MALNRTFTLNTGAKIPAIGFGTWQAAPKEVEKAVEIALRAGYRHLDCAAIYRNETEVGAGIKNSGVKREEIFITSKLWNTKHSSQEEANKALDKTLKDLGTDYLDLYLMHWPSAFAPGDKWFPLDEQGVFKLVDTPFTETYKYMEKLLETGKVKAIGVSNFNVRRLEELLKSCKVVPAVHQFEVHPYLQQPELHALCRKHGIVVEAYSPLGNNQTGEPKTVDDAEVYALSKEVGLDRGQLLYSWGVQNGWVVLPKSVTESRIISNFQDSILSEDTMKRLNALERHKRFNAPDHWGYNFFEEKSDEQIRKTALESGSSNLKKFTV